MNTTILELAAYDRLMDDVIETASGCLISPRTPSQRYATIRVAGVMQKAHRLSYAVSHGLSLDDLSALYREHRMALDHVAARGCVGGHCVNAEHLELVSERENTARGNAPSAAAIRTGIGVCGHYLFGENRKARKDMGPNTAQCRTCERAHSRVRAAARDGRDLRLSDAIASVLAELKWAAMSHDAQHGPAEEAPTLLAA